MYTLTLEEKGRQMGMGVGRHSEEVKTTLCGFQKCLGYDA